VLDYTYMLWTTMNDNIEVNLLARGDRLLPNVIRLIGRMSHMDSLSFRTEELSQSFCSMSVQMGMVSMLRCDLACGRVSADQCVRSTRHCCTQRKATNGARLY
jgi:hypothetical protein